jgi:hypothetical protein
MCWLRRGWDGRFGHVCPSLCLACPSLGRLVESGHESPPSIPSMHACINSGFLPCVPGSTGSTPTKSGPKAVQAQNRVLDFIMCVRVCRWHTTLCPACLWSAHQSAAECSSSRRHHFMSHPRARVQPSTLAPAAVPVVRVKDGSIEAEAAARLYCPQVVLDPIVLARHPYPTE